MPRTETNVRTLYQYSELSDTAKEKAREWLRDCNIREPFDHDYQYEDFATIAGILGIEFKTRTVNLMNGKTRREPCIWYSGFSSQGDGACFEGTYRYAPGASAKIREHAPQDAELHRIADELRDVQRRHFYKLYATVVHTGHYYHSRSVSINVEHGEDTYRDIGDASETVSEALRDLMDWLYKQLEAEYEYQLSDEAIAESIEANEYEFTEAGGRT